MEILTSMCVPLFHLWTMVKQGSAKILYLLSKLHTTNQLLSKPPTLIALLNYWTTPVKYFHQPVSPASLLLRETLTLFGGKI